MQINMLNMSLIVKMPYYRPKTMNINISHILDVIK